MSGKQHFTGFLAVTFSLLLCLIMMSDVTEARSRRKGNKDSREGKFLSMFQVVEFPNVACNGSDSDTKGTCYTAAECNSRGGSNAGVCANGYGVCCTFAIACGEASRENSTTFESRGDEKGQCVAQICKVNEDICQLRLEFNSFSITGPSTSTENSGLLAVDGDREYNRRRTCDTDSFAVASPGVASSPVLCGNNKGEHMYVDIEADCVTLAFNIGSGSDDAEWGVQVFQYPCDFSNLAPQGCTQYIFGEEEGMISSYNFKGGDHLANQNQKICIRREMNNCRICYSIDQADDFQLTAEDADGIAISGKASACCGYGDDNLGYECIIIPSASHVDDNGLRKQLLFEEFCGSKKTFAEFDNIETKTVCSQRVPFEVTFLSDATEVATDPENEGGRAQKGFKMSFTQDRNCIFPELEP